MTRADASTVLAFVPAPERKTDGGLHRCPVAISAVQQCRRATHRGEPVCSTHYAAVVAARRAALAKGGAL